MTHDETVERVLLREVLTWLRDPRLSQWNYMEGTAFYVDKHAMAEKIEAALSALPRADDALALRKEEAAHLQTIDERDIAQATADKLAHLIAQMTGVEIGEHSAGLGCAGNDPHLNAIDAAEAFLRADDALEGLRELSERATGGEWLPWDGRMLKAPADCIDFAILSSAANETARVWTENDARFIAAAVNYVRARLAQAGER